LCGIRDGMVEGDRWDEMRHVDRCHGTGPDGGHREGEERASRWDGDRPGSDGVADVPWWHGIPQLIEVPFGSVCVGGCLNSRTTVQRVWHVTFSLVPPEVDL